MKANDTPTFKKVKKEDLEKWRLLICPWEGGINNSGNHFQKHKGDQE